MRLWYVVTPLLLSSTGLRARRSDVILALQRFYLSGCVYLFQEPSVNFVGGNELHKIQKELSDLHIQTNILYLNASSVFLVNEIRCNRNLPLAVFLKATLAVQQVLEEVSNLSKLSGPTWLLFLNEDDVLEDFFRKVYVPFDCEFLVATPRYQGYRIREVYRTAKELPLRQEFFALCCPLDRQVPALYERRTDLQGLVIKSACLDNPPVTTLRRTKKGYDVDGFIGQVWKVLEKTMNFSTITLPAKDNAWGVKGENGSWDGMIGMILRHEVQMGPTATVMTRSRLQVVDFTIPLLFFNFRVFIRQSGNNQLDWCKYLTPFSNSLWVALLFAILTVATILIFLYQAGRYYGCITPKGHYFSYDAFFYAYAAFCQQDHSLRVQSTSVRLTFFATYMAAVIVLGAYSGALVSSLAVNKPELPFTSLQGLIKNGKYELGVPKRSAIHNMFMEAKDGILRELYQKFMDQNPEGHPPNDLNGMRRVCDSKRYAFIGPLEFTLSQLEKVKCSLAILPEVFTRTSVSMVVAKGSPYLGLLNHNLLKMKAAGVLNKLRIETLPQTLTPPRDPMVRVSFEDILPLLAVLAVGTVLSLLLLLVEQEIHYILRHRKHKLFLKRRRHPQASSRTRSCNRRIQLMLNLSAKR